MAQQLIKIKGARAHNLKNIDLEIPKDKLIVFTGVSGSGKSSLAFDTIYAEGQRRYVESLSSYARQFLGVMDKPDVDYIEGLSPAISIDQKTASHNPRSTVGTITEIYDYLRLLYARAGHPHSPKTGIRLKSQTIQEIVDTLLKLPTELVTESITEVKMLILSPVIKNRKGTYEELFSRFLAQGYSRIRVDGEVFSLEEEIKLDKYKKHNIELVVDRLAFNQDKAIDPEFQKRVTDSVETAVNLGNGELLVNLPDFKREDFFSEDLVDPSTGESFPKIEPHSFSFNSPYGACSKCHGLGIIKEIDVEQIYNPKLSISEGGIYPWANLADNPEAWNMQLLSAVAREEGFDLRIPLSKLTPAQLQIIFTGSGKKRYEFSYIRQSDGLRNLYQKEFEGLIPNLMRRYNETESDYIKAEIEKYMREQVCPECLGKRLNPNSLAVTLLKKNIFHVGELAIDKFAIWLNDLAESTQSEDGLSKMELEIAKMIIKEIKARTQFLVSVGLEYLTLNRSARTLSGGESQRIRLASQIGTGLTGVLYILDEPSVGLHQSDNKRLLHSLENLRDLGNTVIVVEHDEDTIRSADYIVDIGPGAGSHGGEIIAAGGLQEILNNERSITAKYLNGTEIISRENINKEVRKLLKNDKGFIPILEEKIKNIATLELNGVTTNNLKNVDLRIPLGKFIAVTGVSGSGKSSLINETLYPILMNKYYKSKLEVKSFKGIKGFENLDKVIGIDQSPIGRTPRSNPATYTGVFTPIRELFAATREAKARGYLPGRFSFNTKGGRCENCGGDGVLKVEMQFLPDVYVQCDVCNGQRYNRETLQVDFKGMNISQVLSMTVEQAKEFFASIPSIAQKLETLTAVGLGYIKLGQAATTLSGGEAQRVKLATELSKRATGKTIYILDEPTTGLHFDDVKKLLLVLHSLVAKGNTVLVIEHNLDLIRTADWIIDLGPTGGESGGYIICEGKPEEVAEFSDSKTGNWLQKYFKHEANTYSKN